MEPGVNDFEARIPKGTSDGLGAPIVAIKTRFCDDNAVHPVHEERSVRGQLWHYPNERGDTSLVLRRWRSPVGQAVGPVLIGIAFLALLGSALWVAAWVATRSDDGARFGADNLLRLRSERTLTDIERFGPRLQYVGTTRGYIYVNHVGADPTKGWFAFDAVPAGLPNRCTVVFRPNDAVFTTDCRPDRSYPADGAGLAQYETTANPNTSELVIDLSRSIERPGPSP